MPPFGADDGRETIVYFKAISRKSTLSRPTLRIKAWHLKIRPNGKP